jgi:hypothetical protein
MARTSYFLNEILLVHWELLASLELFNSLITLSRIQLIGKREDIEGA